jgi:hypothetical protein
MINGRWTNLRGYFLDYRVVHLSMDERAVCLDNNVIVLAVLYDVTLLVERVELDMYEVGLGSANSYPFIVAYLDLVDRWLFITRSFDLF